MKYVLLCLMAALMAGCSPSIYDLQDQVKTDLQEKLKNDPSMQNIITKIDAVHLINKTGNEYLAVITVSKDATIGEIQADVVDDGTSPPVITPDMASLSAFILTVQKTNGKPTYQQRIDACTGYYNDGQRDKYLECLRKTIQK